MMNRFQTLLSNSACAVKPWRVLLPKLRRDGGTLGRQDGDHARGGHVGSGRHVHRGRHDGVGKCPICFSFCPNADAEFSGFQPKMSVKMTKKCPEDPQNIPKMLRMAKEYSNSTKFPQNTAYARMLAPT